MSNEWGLEKGEWRDSNPFGTKVQNYIMTYPEWSIYLRRDTRFKCENHFDQATETPKSFGETDCWCWGLGTAVSGSIVPCRVSRGRNAEITPLDGEVREAPGYIDYNQDVVHFPRAVLPQVNDLILQCEWTTSSQKITAPHPRSRPVRIHSIYIIRLINAHFQRELSHFSCGVETLNIEAGIMNSLIPEKLVNLPVLDVEQTWQQISYWSD
jgi:hypothetical protein